MQGLGVVCNKEEGFAEDDFVVEFLGEGVQRENMWNELWMIQLCWW